MSFRLTVMVVGFYHEIKKVCVTFHLRFLAFIPPNLDFSAQKYEFISRNYRRIMSYELNSDKE